jgi:pilus assembly protein Flp/PilA
LAAIGGRSPQTKSSSIIFGESNMFARFMKDESGATAIEYGLIAALLSVAIIATLQLVRTELVGTYTDIQTNLQSR